VNVVADEDVDGPIVQRLRAGGHDVLYIAELSPSAVDEDVLVEATERGALLITVDKDFGELVFRQGLVHSGVLLLRLEGLTNPTKAQLVGEVFRDRGQELLGGFSVLSPGRLRIRRTP